MTGPFTELPSPVVYLGFGDAELLAVGRSAEAGPRLFCLGFDDGWPGFPPETVYTPSVLLHDGEPEFLAAGSPIAADEVVRAVAAWTNTPLRRGRIVEDRDRFRDAVGVALEEIGGRADRKIVLARSVTFETDADPFVLARRLRMRFPAAYTFAWWTGRAAFVGASPELLVRRRGGRIQSVPLAGSVLPGGRVDTDKNLREHRFVVDDIVARLRPVVTDLRVAGPEPMELPNVTHLATTIDATGSVDVVDVARLLHPTPAVGGTPRPFALDRIRRLEPPRGWYSGAIGYVAENGDGEAAVAIRSLLLEDGVATVYAGAGVVAGSDPDAELAETDAKLAAVVDLFSV